MTFPDWWQRMAEAEPEHHALFVGIELDVFEAMAGAMARLADLEDARTLDRAALADRGPGAVGWLADDDDEVQALRERVAVLKRWNPGGYTGE